MTNHIISSDILKAAAAQLQADGHSELARELTALLEKVADAWPKLQKPVLVGKDFRFGTGVSSRLVVEAAQRHYEHEVTPEKEAERIARANAAGSFLDVLLQNDVPESASQANISNG
jgi:hypothetical protein